MAELDYVLNEEHNMFDELVEHMRNTSDYNPHVPFRSHYRHRLVSYLYQHTFPYLESTVLLLVWDYIQ